jgi:hypothetical protein
LRGFRARVGLQEDGSDVRPGPREVDIMKRLLFAAVLSVAGAVLTTGQASAGLFNKCCGCTTTICIRPYNAFSPVCCGALACDGCFPFAGGPGAGQPQGWGSGYCCPSPWSCGTCPSGYSGDSCGTCSSGPGMPPATAQTAPAPGSLPPVNNVPTMQGPPLAPMPVGTNSGAMARPYPVQAANYWAGYYPAYNPAPMQQAYPGYGYPGYGYNYNPYTMPWGYPAYYGQQGMAR